MNEDDYISMLRSYEQDEEVSLERIQLADEAVRAFPHSAQLLVLCGNLIELGPDDGLYSLNDALACYQKAIDIDPLFAEAWEEIGNFHDAVLNDEVTARTYFREAERLRQAD